MFQPARHHTPRRRGRSLGGKITSTRSLPAHEPTLLLTRAATAALFWQILVMYPLDVVKTRM